LFLGSWVFIVKIYGSVS